LGASAAAASSGGPGDRIRITVDASESDHDLVSTTYKQLAHDVKSGDRPSGRRAFALP
jgi:pyruvate kinase